MSTNAMEVLEISAIKIKGKGFYCELCDTKLATEQCVKDHVQGKKHQRIISLKSTREEQAEKSVFVGGLCRLVSELELTDFFSEFGPISQVIIDKEKSKYAIVEFTSPKAATKAVESEKQTMNGRKILVRPKENKPFMPRRRGNKRGGNVVLSSDEVAMFNNLAELKDHISQINALVTATSLSYESVKLRYLICGLLKEVFCEFSSHCHVYPYGSSVNGFGREGCDLDIHLSLSHAGEGFSYKFAKFEDDDDEEEVADQSSTPAITETDDVTTDLDFNSAGDEEVLQFVCQVLRKCVPSCQNVRVIPSARKPLVKFIHKESSLHCDVVLNNRLSLRNTELLQLYTQLCSHVRPLIFNIRQWAKCRQLAGNVGAGPRLTNYALTWLVVFFLQKKGVVPSVETLRRCDDSGTTVTIDKWNCSFQSDVEKIPKAATETSADTLLTEFFEFYSLLDFATTIISPMQGEVTPIGQFCESNEGFKRGPMNIQDPLELTHNVTMNVNERVASSFKQECKKAALLCITTRFKKYPVRTSEDDQPAHWGVVLLFQPPQPTQSKKESDCSESFNILLSLKSQQLSKDFIAQHQDSDSLKSAWQRGVQQLVLHILKDALSVKCFEMEDEMDSCEADDNSVSESIPHGGKSRGVESMRSNDEAQGGGGGAQGGGDATQGGEVGAMQIGDISANSEMPIRKEIKGKRGYGEDDTNKLTSKRQKTESKTKLTEASDLKDVTADGNFSNDKSHKEQEKIKIRTELADADEGDISGSLQTTEAYSCEICHQVWIGRRKVRRQIQQSGDAKEGLELEKQVTEKIIELQRSPGSKREDVKCLSKFVMNLKTDDEGSVVVDMALSEGEGDFKAFFNFLEVYLPKLVNQQTF